MVVDRATPDLYGALLATSSPSATLAAEGVSLTPGTAAPTRAAGFAAAEEAIGEEERRELSIRTAYETKWLTVRGPPPGATLPSLGRPR